MTKGGGGFASAINVERLGRETLTFNIHAMPTELAALAKQLDVLEISSLSASGSLQRQSKTGQIRVLGEFQASVMQACVVTLDPVVQDVDEEFEVFFTFDKEDLETEEPDHTVGMDEMDLPELIVDNQIDIAVVLGEQIALALDPYPRSKGLPDDDLSETGMKSETNDNAEEVHRPFANLRDLMNKK